MRVIGLIILIMAFGIGYLSGKSQPEIIRFEQVKVSQEVRDSSFRRCELMGSTGTSNHSIEESWRCPNKDKFFVVKRASKFQSEQLKPNRKSIPLHSSQL
jgi:hypothetical protein